MVKTIMICIKLSDKLIHTTYINIKGEDVYLTGIKLSEPPWNPIASPDIPSEIGQFSVTTVG